MNKYFSAGFRALYQRGKQLFNKEKAQMRLISCNRLPRAEFNQRAFERLVALVAARVGA